MAADLYSPTCGCLKIGDCAAKGAPATNSCRMHNCRPDHTVCLMTWLKTRIYVPLTNLIEMSFELVGKLVHELLITLEATLCIFWKYLLGTLNNFPQINTRVVGLAVGGCPLGSESAVKASTWFFLGVKG